MTDSIALSGRAKSANLSNHWFARTSSNTALNLLIEKWLWTKRVKLKLSNGRKAQSEMSQMKSGEVR